MTMALASKDSIQAPNIEPFCSNLNYSKGDTINHSVVLLEGQIGTCIINDDTLTKIVKETSDPENGVCINEIDKELSNSKEPQLLVHQKGFFQAWPIIGGKFKAFVKLDKGINKLTLECPLSQSKQDLILTYKKLQNQPRFVKVVYIKCSDSKGVFDTLDDRDNDLNIAIKKLRLNALLLQSFTAVDMYKHGFGYQTFQLEEDEDDEVVVHVFDSELTTEQAHKMDGGQLYKWFHSELLKSSLHDPNCKFLVFMSCTHYDPPEDMDSKHVTKYLKAHTALGGGHLGLFGTAGLHTWARDLGELVKCFTDSREIDKKKLFDDSAGRGTYWANYSTTLGAALHELGHCFDLAHTEKGIMGRGFDDMNLFFTVTQRKTERKTQCSTSTEIVAPGNDAERIFINHEAHWFRSSAVLLHYHKWLRRCYKPSSTEEEHVCLQVNWAPHVKGPVGSGGGQNNESYFNNDISSGYIIYHSDYINALQVLTPGSVDKSSKDSVIFGKANDTCLVHVFPLEEGEYLASVEIRAGAWIDGIRFHTNLKSSIWFGGRGGNWYHLKPTTGDRIMGIFGTYGDYIGSLGIRVDERSSSNEMQVGPNLEIQSDLGIRLVELRNKHGVSKFWEFIDENPPKTFHFPWKDEENREDCSVFVEDNGGNMCESGLCGFKTFMEEARKLDTVSSTT